MRRPHESYVSPSMLTQTLWGLGVRGIVPPGALAWQTYPSAAGNASVHGNTTDAADSIAVGVIAPGAITTPYYITHINEVEQNRDGGRISRSKIQDFSGNNLRIFRFQNPAKQTSGIKFGNNLVQEILAMSMPGGSGVKFVVATDNNSFDIEHGCYVTVLLVEPQIVPALLTKTPTALGAVLPTTAAGLALTSGSTEWTFPASYSQLTAGLATGAIVTTVIISSTSINNGQVAFATGGAGSEIDWGIFPWADPVGTTLTAARYSLMPFPLYLPPSTRLAARARSGNPSDTFNVGIEYLPIPLR